MEESLTIKSKETAKSSHYKLNSNHHHKFILNEIAEKEETVHSIQILTGYETTRLKAILNQMVKQKVLFHNGTRYRANKEYEEYVNPKDSIAIKPIKRISGFSMARIV